MIKCAFSGFKLQKWPVIDIPERFGKHINAARWDRGSTNRGIFVPKMKALEKRPKIEGFEHKN